MSPETPEILNEEQLWTLITKRSLTAFEEFVRRHQAAVASVAYSICGDVMLSEDIAQEAFLTAWQTSECLREPQKSRAWVCGIARNLANGEVRKTRRNAVSLQSMTEDNEPASALPGIPDSVVRNEEESVVWKSLEEIPETYRESLVLFYREGQSISAIAGTLDISEETARQRLSRGRDLLRHQVAAVIEGTLVRTRPAAAFTGSVMAAVAVLSGTSKAAMAAGSAGTVTAGSAIAKTAVSTLAAGGTAGLIGGLAGTAGGLAGGWLGTWLPAQFAPTNKERIYILRFGKRIMLVSLLSTFSFIAVMYALVHWQAAAGTRISATLIFVFGLQVWILFEVLRHTRVLRKIRAEASADAEPNPSQIGRRLHSKMLQYEGRVWQSKTVLLGRPLIDINVSDPGTGCDTENRLRVRTARGWIAIGDRAHGILLGVGGRAIGLVAFGGISIGLISLGGLSIGVFSLGGLAVGLISVGGLGIGGLAMGGLAVGYQAMGGLALAWDFACGGGAASFRWAFGGAAWSGEAAVGGAAWAPLANTPEIRKLMEAHWMVGALKWQTENNWIFILVTTSISLLPSLLITPLMYRRKTTDCNSPPAQAELPLKNESNDK